MDKEPVLKRWLLVDLVQMVGVVGATGTGKSTPSSIDSTSLWPAGRAIKLKRDIREVVKNRKTVSIVLQRTSLWTIADNLRRETEILYLKWNARNITWASEFIHRMEKLWSPVEKGNCSGGRKQRIVINDCQQSIFWFWSTSTDKSERHNLRSLE